MILKLKSLFYFFHDMIFLNYDNIYDYILLCQYLYFLDLKKTATSMNDSLAHKPKIRFVRQRNDAITPDIIRNHFGLAHLLH